MNNSLKLAEDNIIRLYGFIDTLVLNKEDKHSKNNTRKRCRSNSNDAKYHNRDSGIKDGIKDGIRDDIRADIRDDIRANMRHQRSDNRKKIRRGWASEKIMKKKEDGHLLNIIERRESNILKKQKESLSYLRSFDQSTNKIEDVINKSMLLTLSSFKYKSYINSRKTQPILDFETIIKYAIMDITDIENKSQIEIRNIIGKCLDEHLISRRCKLCSGVGNYPHFQQNYIPIICGGYSSSGYKLCIICNKCVSDLAKKDYRGSIGAAVKAIKENYIY
uniref:Uncharacterized protein n=1 Tax=viral metagenome TaxID=1070528 RepID=A0A6C0I0U0_9ZZZZ